MNNPLDQHELIEKCIKKYCSSEKVLDLGVGNLEYSKIAKENGAEEVCAVDIINPKKYVEGIKFFKENAEETHFNKKRFDLIICKGLIEYVDLGRGIKEIDRLIKPGGIILLQEKDSRGFQHKLYRLSLRIRNKSADGLPFNFKKLKGKIEENFKIIKFYETFPKHNIFWILKGGK